MNRSIFQQSPPTARPIVALLALMLGLAFAADARASGPEQPEVVVIKAGTVITADGEDIERGEIVIVDGTITLVGTGLEFPATATVIEARDQVVMPGLINPRSSYGLPNYFTRGLNGGIRTIDQITWDAIDFEPLLRAGFTTHVLNPVGDGIPGIAAAVATAADEDWQRIIDRDVYLRVDFTGFPTDKANLRSAIVKARSEIKKREDARKKWEQEQAKKKAEAEAKKKAEEDAKENAAEGDDANKQEESGEETFTPPPFDANAKPIIDLLQNNDDRVPAMIELASASGLIHLNDLTAGLTEDESFDHFICLTRARFTDFSYVVDELASREVGIFLPADLSTIPQTANQYNLAGELAIRGATIAFMPSPDNRAGYDRFLRSVAGLVRIGLPRDEAIAAITTNPAKILRLDRRLGSIATGKFGNLVFLSRDPLDPNARVTRVMVRGNTVFQPEND